MPPPFPAWCPAPKTHPGLLALADRHYTRQRPGTKQFCRPGVNFTLLLSDNSAGWATWRPIPQVGRMDDLEAWECTFFRNEGARLSSELIAEATELTYRAWGWPPRDGLITAVGIDATRGRRSRWSPPGRCFLAAGWSLIAQSHERVWLAAPRPRKWPRRRPPLTSLYAHPPSLAPQNNGASPPAA